MSIFRQNRWIALLIGVILVCFSAICLLLQSEQVQGWEKESKLPLLETMPLSILADGTVHQLEKTNVHSGSSLKLVHSIKLHQVEDIESLFVNKNLVINSTEPLGFKNQLFKKQLELVQADEEAEAEKKAKAAQKAKAKKAAQVKEEAKAQKEAIAKKIAEVNPKLNPPQVLFFTRTKTLSQQAKDQSTWQYAVSDEELLMLRKIVMAEAEGEPYEGKVAVANVVLNRLRSANFPNTIEKVIYQKFQFSPVGNGRFKRVKPDKDTVHAVNEAMNGRKEVSDDTYYFLSLQLADDLTVKHTRTYSETIGNHTFYK
ncbi:N-acetylmuramoyl-L-alanine amidase [Paenibacillus sp. DS2015]|uniref:cell wall hydrolase n=1 Tax=Paenibacillus sp. DS2015 TaxID=3373917 RepID=UPI003D1AAE36